jgi:hypothetical protein
MSQQDLSAGESASPETVLDVDACVREWDEALETFWAEGDKYPAEWWDEFERDLQANRLNFEERVWLPD